VMKLPDYHLETQIRIEPPSGKGISFRIRYKSPDTNNNWTILKLPEIDLANRLLNDGVVSREHTHQKLKIILAAQYRNSKLFLLPNMSIVTEQRKKRHS